MTRGETTLFLDIQNKPEFTLAGDLREVRCLDSFCFMMNTFAMGDVIASAAVIKYLVDKFYTKPESYIVVAKNGFRDFFPFVPDANFRDFDKKENFWGIPLNFAIGSLNRKIEPKLVRITPKSMHLSDYASLVFADRLIPHDQLEYVQPDITGVDISKFGIDFSKAVILVSSYRDLTRSWQSQSILETATWLKNNGFIPVFIGKTNMDQHLADAQKPKTNLPDNLEDYGFKDLRNKTTIKELVAIFKESKAVCGVDSGPIHLAGTTSASIICGYTSVAPEHRIPIRRIGTTIPLTANIPCIGCESRWRSNYWNFENCYHGHANCSKLLTSDRFITALTSIL